MMNKKWLLRLYPQAWRNRYEDEFLALLEQRGIRFFDIIDIVRGAIDAHLHPQPSIVGSFSERWETLMLQRLRRRIIIVFCAYIGFFVASMVFGILVNDSYFITAIQANSDTSITFDLIVAASIIALLAILVGGLPIAWVVFRQALATRKKDALLFGVPFLSLAILILVRIFLNAVDGGNTPQALSILYGILFLLVAIISSAAVCIAVARNDIAEHHFRFALIPATIATVAMLLVLGLLITWGVRLQGDVPYLFYGPQTMGGTMNTTAQAEWIGIVIVIAVSTIITIAALIRGLPARMTSRAA